MKRTLQTVALLGAAALAPSAFAQTPSDWTGLYLGGQVG